MSLGDVSFVVIPTSRCGALSKEQHYRFKYRKNDHSPLPQTMCSTRVAWRSPNLHAVPKISLHFSWLQSGITQYGWNLRLNLHPSNFAMTTAFDHRYRFLKSHGGAGHIRALTVCMNDEGATYPHPVTTSRQVVGAFGITPTMPFVSRVLAPRNHHVDATSTNNRERRW